MRPVFCGNLDYDTRVAELERLFGKYGRVDRVDMKSEMFGQGVVVEITKYGGSSTRPILISSMCNGGFAFIYFEDERDGDYAIRRLDNTPFGYSRRRLSVEWARGDRGPRFRDGYRGGPDMRPTKTLFVIHFDPVRTRTSDIERHFEPYGKITNVRIRRNFAFVQFATQEEATRALEATNMSKILDRVVSVEYALRDDGEPDRRESPRGGGGGGGYGRRRSPYGGRSLSPVPRNRPSPDYGRGRSPAYNGYDGPAYDRGPSPDYGRYRSRSPIRRSRS